MSQLCIIPPAILAVTLEQAKLNLRVDGDYLDALIEFWLRGIISALEHEIGQCLMPQTWEVRLDEFPAAIDLPHPVLNVVSVVYLDANGVERVLEPATYKLVATRYQTTLALAREATWPATSVESHAVIVTVECGYGYTPNKVPSNVQLYLLAKLVDQFDPNTRAERESAPSPFIARLLDACRSSV
ncbi:head-tail connector protein [Janthinobacterium sp. P210005]|uniref:head-tail connector protein n=1 Tax=Janthinobacterium sp. P210005 TaxID=3112938 RepID=UPI002E2666D4|nr:hypothetical protein [Janthinobacterium sp. P210005]